MVPNVNRVFPFHPASAQIECRQTRTSPGHCTRSQQRQQCKAAVSDNNIKLLNRVRSPRPPVPLVGRATHSSVNRLLVATRRLVFTRTWAARVRVRLRLRLPRVFVTGLDESKKRVRELAQSRAINHDAAPVAPCLASPASLRPPPTLSGIKFRRGLHIREPTGRETFLFLRWTGIASGTIEIRRCIDHFACNRVSRWRSYGRSLGDWFVLRVAWCECSVVLV